MTSNFLGFWTLTLEIVYCAIRKLVLDFLSIFYWQFASKSYRFKDIWLQWFDLDHKLLEVIWGQNISAIRKPIHHSLSDFFWLSIWYSFRVRPWPLTFRGHLGSKVFLLYESSCLIFYLTSIDIVSLSRTVLEIFAIKVFRVWPWPLTFRGHLRWKIFSPFESPCMTSYLTYIDIFSLSRTVFDIFDFKNFRVWTWPLTFRGHLRSKFFSPFDSPCMTSYLTPIDIFSLSRTIFEIFDFEVCRVWPWLLSFRGHLGSKIFSPFESPCMTSYLTSIDIFSLSRTVFEIFDF